MSNCIEFANGTRILKFHPDDIRVHELLAETDLHLTHERNCKLESDNTEPRNEYLRCCTFHWFLNRENITIYADRIEIELGAANSGHTWRDWRQTLWLISQFISRPVHHVFKITDETAKSTATVPITLMPNSWPIETRTGKAA